MKIASGAVAAFIFATLPAAGLAQEDVRADQPTLAPAFAPAPADDPFGTAGALDEVALGKITGREDTALMVARATQQNTVANNSVSGTSVTGNVQIDGNAFQNLQGLAVISANSGNNVAINSAMNVTINMAPR